MEADHQNAAGSYGSVAESYSGSSNAAEAPITGDILQHQKSHLPPKLRPYALHIAALGVAGLVAMGLLGGFLFKRSGMYSGMKRSKLVTSLTGNAKSAYETSISILDEVGSRFVDGEEEIEAFRNALPEMLHQPASGRTVFFIPLLKRKAALLNHMQRVAREEQAFKAAPSAETVAKFDEVVDEQRGLIDDVRELCKDTLLHIKGDFCAPEDAPKWKEIIEHAAEHERTVAVVVTALHDQDVDRGNADEVRRAVRGLQAARSTLHKTVEKYKSLLPPGGGYLLEWDVLTQSGRDITI